MGGFALSPLLRLSPPLRRLLRLVLYDPASSETRELRLALTHRAVVLGSAAADWRSWRPELLKRLSLRRKRVARALEAQGSPTPERDKSPLKRDTGAVLDADGVCFDTSIWKKAVFVGKRRGHRIVMCAGTCVEPVMEPGAEISAGNCKRARS